MIDFSCSKCDKCCSNILSNINGNIFGLYLSKDEIYKFPENVIFPLCGRGDPIKTTAYQLGVQVCPHLTKISEDCSICSIHQNRPLFCRTYPLLSHDRISEKVVLCRNCPVVNEVYNRQEDFSEKSLAEEICAHNKKADQLRMEAIQGKQDEYMWPINKKKWIKIEEIYTKEKI